MRRNLCAYYPSGFQVQVVKRVLLITGLPGVGKTTVLTTAIDILRERGFSVGGMLSREARENGVRVGFEIVDLASQKHGWLAHVKQPSGPRVGKYRVNLQDLEAVGTKAITEATEKCDVVAIDEIGPMELFSQKFRDAVETAMKSRKTVIAVVHWKVKDKLVDSIKTREDAEIFAVTPENRDQLSQTIAEKT
jgi:nucleoside-triphosphatase